MGEVEGVQSKFTQEGAQFGGKRRKRGKSKTRRTRRGMRGGAGAGPPEEGVRPDGTQMGGKSRRKKGKARKARKSRSSRK